MIDPERHFLMPISILLTLPSVDASYADETVDGGRLGTVESTREYKMRDIRSYGWSPDEWEQNYPVHVFIPGREDISEAMGGGYISDERDYRNQLVMGNGHHRVIFLSSIGAEYVWCSFNEGECG